MPLFSTNRMPIRAARLAIRGRPPFGFGGVSGISGSITAHRSSDTRGAAIPRQQLTSGFVRLSKTAHQRALSRINQARIMQRDCGNFRGVRAGGGGDTLTGPEQVRAWLVNIQRLVLGPKVR